MALSLGTVVPDSLASVGRGTAGEALTEGDALRFLSGKYHKAQADAAATATVSGVAVHDAALDQPIAFIVKGKLTVSTQTVGRVVSLDSVVDGGLVLVDDLAVGAILSVVGYMTTATELTMDIFNTAAVRA